MPKFGSIQSRQSQLLAFLSTVSLQPTTNLQRNRGPSTLKPCGPPLNSESLHPEALKTRPTPNPKAELSCSRRRVSVLLQPSFGTLFRPFNTSRKDLSDLSPLFSSLLQSHHQGVGGVGVQAAQRLVEEPSTNLFQGLPSLGRVLKLLGLIPED